VLKTPEPVTAEVPLASQQRAEEIFATTCSVCHGTDGRLTELSRGFEPPPPDFSVHQLAPRWAFEVITRGYPGTMMPGFPSLPEDVRWGLVKIVQQQRKPDRP
jgi:mono/diheme cytochrome c family protein